MNNRQAGRRRGRGGQRQGGNPGRPDNGNRIDNRARGNAAQLLEKYKNLATDAQRGGDRVTTEYYLQFADHYFRVLAESRSRMEDGQQRRPRDDEGDEEGVEDFGFEGDLGSPAYYQQPQPTQVDRDDRDDRPRRDGNSDRDRDDQPRQRDDRPRQRDDQPRQRDDQPRQRDDQPRQRDDQPRQRDDQQREARPRRDRDASGEGQRPRRESGNREPANREPSNDVGEERPRREPRSYVREAVAEEPRAEPVAESVERPAAANDEPRRRGRPRRETAPVESDGLDAAVLPPAISVEPTPAEDAPAERPRRGRPRRVRNDDEVVPPAA